MHIRHNNILLQCALGLIFIFPAISHAQNFYKWVDANGSTHYTTTPPPKNVKKLGTVATYGNTPTSGYNPSAQSNNNSNNTAETVAKTAEAAANAAAEQKKPPSNTNTATSSTNNERIPLPPKQSDPTAGQTAPMY